MTQMYTTGTWRPKPGREQDFVAAWTEFAQWGCGQPGARTLRLSRDTDDPGRYVSMGLWDSEDQVHAWTALPDFRERIGRVLQHVDGFDRAELSVVAVATRPAAARI